MKRIRTLILLLLLSVIVPAITGCGSTSENGVTIDKSGNPLKFW